MNEALNKRAIIKFIRMRIRELDRQISDEVELEEINYKIGKLHELNYLYEMIDEGDFDLYVD